MSSLGLNGRVAPAGSAWYGGQLVPISSLPYGVYVIPNSGGQTTTVPPAIQDKVVLAGGIINYDLANNIPVPKVAIQSSPVTVQTVKLAQQVNSQAANPTPQPQPPVQVLTQNPVVAVKSLPVDWMLVAGLAVAVLVVLAVVI